MIINLRGGLGNQIIQLGFLLKQNSINKKANINAINLRQQLGSVKDTRFINSKFVNYLFGFIRKFISVLKNKPQDFACCGVCDGYFQFGDITDLLESNFKRHLESQIYTDNCIKEEIDIVIHIRGGDYFTESAEKVFEICDEIYYLNALEIAFNKINKAECNIFIVTNDKIYSEGILAKIFDKDKYSVYSYSESEWKDFSLISRARVAIIPNSTFSMMARMLLEEENKLTIAPIKWFTKESKLTPPYNKYFLYV
jgi:hypothetical protein